MSYYNNSSNPLSLALVGVFSSEEALHAARDYGPYLLADGSHFNGFLDLFNFSDAEPCAIGEREPHSETPLIVRNITSQFKSPFSADGYEAWNIALKVTFYVIAMILATVGNLLVIITIAVNKTMQNSMNVYLFNLAVSDLMVVFFCMWVHLGANITVDWPFGGFICKVYPFFQITAVSASVLFLAVVAGERFFAIVYPLKRRFSKRSIHIMVIIITWSLAVIIAIPNLLTRNLQTLYWSDREQTWCEERWPRVVVGEEDDNITRALPFLRFCIYDQPGRRIYYTIQFTVMYLVPILVMTVAYTVILCHFRTYQMPGNVTDNLLAHQHKTKRKVIKMLIIVFLTFVLCWTPHEVLLVYNAFNPENVSQIPPAVNFAALYVAYLNSALNPILYAGLNARVRKAIKETMFCSCFKKNKVAPDATYQNGSAQHNALKDSQAPSSIYMTSTSERRRSPYMAHGGPSLPTIAEDEAEREAAVAELQSETERSA